MLTAVFVVNCTRRHLLKYRLFCAKRGNKAGLYCIHRKGAHSRMKTLEHMTILIKPASGACNMRCGYCFYADELQHRESPCIGFMDEKVCAGIIRLALSTAKKSCTFTFQGGEPTLCGIAFFENFVAEARRQNTTGIHIDYAIQTNGYNLNEAWAQFFAEHRFLVGLSLDGTKQQHNRWRKNAQGDGTFQAVMRSAKLLKRFAVPFNLLTVVTAQTAQGIDEIYHFYRHHNLPYQQYIPCLDPLGQPRGEEAYSLTPQLYGDFLKTLFDLWYADITGGRFIYIRYFENLVAMLTGRPPESCGMLGHCTLQYVVEADGGVYPCDFYVLDSLHLGNVLTDDIEAIEAKRRQTQFLAQSTAGLAQCKACQWGPICRGGCRRDRELPQGTLGENYFCEAYKTFFAHAMPRLSRLAHAVQRGTHP